MATFESRHLQILFFHIEVGFVFSFLGKRTSFGCMDSLEFCSDEAVAVFPLDLEMYKLKVA